MLTYRTRTATTRIIVHDSHEVKTPAALLTTGRVMGLLEVGYHYVLPYDGGILRMRHHGVVGSHCPGFNNDSVGVCIMRSEGEEGFSKRQLKNLAVLLCSLHANYPEAKILGHDEVVTRRKAKHRCPDIDMDSLRSAIMDPHELEANAKPLPEVRGEDGLSTQNRLLLSYLGGRGPLTNQTAIIELGIGSLTSRVAELRKLGYPITDETKNDFHGHRYKVYTLGAMPFAHVEPNP